LCAFEHTDVTAGIQPIEEPLVHFGHSYNANRMYAHVAMSAQRSQVSFYIFAASLTRLNVMCITWAWLAACCARLCFYRINQALVYCPLVFWQHLWLSVLYVNAMTYGIRPFRANALFLVLSGLHQA